MNLDHLQSIAFVQKLALDAARTPGTTTDAVEVGGLPAVHRPAHRADADRRRQDRRSRSARRTSRRTTPAPTPARSRARSSRSSTARYVIIGHSERRQYHAETDERRRRQGRRRRCVTALVPVICVGETADDLEEFGPSAVPVGQLRVALEGVPGRRRHRRRLRAGLGDRLGSGGDARAGAGGLRRSCATVIAEVLGADAAARTRVLYGGSVKSANIASFMREPDVDGALVGGASLAGRRVRGDHPLPEARRRLTSR